MDSEKNRAVRQRRLHFEEEEIWTELPESVREHCRTLWRQLLASVLKELPDFPLKVAALA